MSTTVVLLVLAGLALLSRSSASAGGGTTASSGGVGPPDIRGIAEGNAEAWGVEPLFFFALIEQESGWAVGSRSTDPRDEARGGSYGLTGITLATAIETDDQLVELGQRSPWRAIDGANRKPGTLYEPDVNTWLAAAHLAWLATELSRVGDPSDLHTLYAAYNGGIHGWRRDEPQRNADKVMQRYARLQGAV